MKKWDRKVGETEEIEGWRIVLGALRDSTPIFSSVNIESDHNICARVNYGSSEKSQHCPSKVCICRYS
jgi:hypothetical protein